MAIDRSAKIRSALDGVVTAMKREGVWDVARPSDDAFQDMGAFGARTMAFAAWLRWVFVPNVERALDTDGPWPRESNLAVIAVREGDTDLAIAGLVDALSRFDALFSD